MSSIGTGVASGGAADVATHEAAVDPHTGYLKESDAATTYGPIGSKYVTIEADATLTAEQLVGTSVIMSGTLAARPAAAAGNTGCLYHATDVLGGQHYRSTGAAWVRVGASRDATQLIATSNLDTAQAAATVVVLATAGIIPANSLEAGSVIHGGFMGELVAVSNGAAGTITQTVRMGGAAGAIFGNTTALSVLNSTAQTKSNLILFDIVIIDIGASGHGVFQFRHENAWGSNATNQHANGGGSATPVAVDTTAAQTVDLCIAWSQNTIGHQMKNIAAWVGIG